MRRTLASLAAAATLIAAAHAETKDVREYKDEARGFSMRLPDGWTDPKGGMMTTSADGSVRCNVTAQPTPKTADMTQDQVNASMQAYTADIWEQRFFTGGAKGVVTDSGITRLDLHDAPWARGTVEYPRSPLAKFGVILVPAPGKLVSVTCTGEPAAYDKNLHGVTTILNWIRPL